jgi:hypothetical protein
VQNYNQGENRMCRRLLIPLLAVSCTVGCASQPKRILWREMLGRSINDFAQNLPDNNAQKVWIHNMDDKECDKGCQKGVEVCGKGDAAPAVALPAMPAVGGLFGAASGGGGQWDGLAFEVFSNFMTQKHKGRVIESHHHN